MLCPGTRNAEAAAMESVFASGGRRTMMRAAINNVSKNSAVISRSGGGVGASLSTKAAPVSRKARTPTTTTTPSSLLRSSSPFWNRSTSSPLARWFDDMERDLLGNDPFFAPVTRPFAAVSTDLTMNLDVSETDKQYVIKAELPGVKKEDVKVSFKDHVLSIVAERKEEHHQEGGKEGEVEVTKHYSDFAWGKIRRDLRMPETADKDAIDASLEDGVLTVRVNKSEEAAKETTITIK